jgi:hypothetical protein
MLASTGGAPPTSRAPSAFSRQTSASVSGERLAGSGGSGRAGCSGGAAAGSPAPWPGCCKAVSATIAKGLVRA